MAHTARISLPSRADPLIEAVRRDIREHRLIAEGSTVLIACSGGADSVALAVILRVLREPFDLTLHLGHVNHRTRGADSDADARWVVALGQALGIPAHLGSVDVPRLHHTRGGSFEEVARDARFQLLRDMRRTTGADVIATGHHEDDQAETVLMHLVRGSGVTGLGGMSRRGGDIARPLLSLRRSEIQKALARWDIPWREDVTNASTDYERNRVRHDLIPLLAQEWNPRITGALGRLAEIAAGDDEALEAYAEHAWKTSCEQASPQAVLLDCAALRAYHSAIKRRVIRRAALALRTVIDPLTYAETGRLESLVEVQGAVTLRGRLHAVSKRGMLWIEAIDAWRGPTPVHIPGVTSIPGWGKLVASYAEEQEIGHKPGRFTLQWPADHLAGHVTLRRWRAGDRITRRRGHPAESLADLARRTSEWRLGTNGLLVMEHEERIIWAVGLAAAQLPRTPERSSTILLTWEKE